MFLGLDKLISTILTLHWLPFPNVRTVEDFDDWTNWLLYKGGVGVKGENSWESWWDEEQVSNYDCLEC
jgi:hypothetical protein